MTTLRGQTCHAQQPKLVDLSSRFAISTSGWGRFCIGYRAEFVLTRDLFDPVRDRVALYPRASRDLQLRSALTAGVAAAAQDDLVHVQPLGRATSEEAPSPTGTAINYAGTSQEILAPSGGAAAPAARRGAAAEDAATASRGTSRRSATAVERTSGTEGRSSEENSSSASNTNHAEANTPTTMAASGMIVQQDLQAQPQEEDNIDNHSNKSLIPHWFDFLRCLPVFGPIFHSGMNPDDFSDFVVDPSWDVQHGHYSRWFPCFNTVEDPEEGSGPLCTELTNLRELQKNCLCCSATLLTCGTGGMLGTFPDPRMIGVIWAAHVGGCAACHLVVISAQKLHEKLQPVSTVKMSGSGNL